MRTLLRIPYIQLLIFTFLAIIFFQFTVLAGQITLNLSGTASGYSACASVPQSFSYIGAADQTLTVPANCTKVTIRAWGAGGGGQASLYGGGGGFILTNQITVAGGTVLYIRVGQGGAG